MTRLRAAIVGAGSMGRAWARTVSAHPEVDLVSWVDIDPELARTALREMGAEESSVVVESGLLAALERSTPDFVVDVTIPEAHAEVTAMCLERRIPVLGEKPMAATLAEARELVKRSEASGTLFVVSQNRRYNHGLIGFRRLLERLGNVGQLTAEFYQSPHFGGFRDEMASPLILDMAIHTFDAARYLIGADPVSVYCVEFNPTWSWYEGAASAVAEFVFDGGAHFSYSGSWCAHGLETSWDASWRAVGSKGSALWDGSEPPVAEIVRDTKAPAASSGSAEVYERLTPGNLEDAREGIAGSLDAFVDALQNGGIPMNECHDNIKSMAMVVAALESSRSGMRVPVRW